MVERETVDPGAAFGARPGQNGTKPPVLARCAIWPTLGSPALHGLAGAYVTAIGPYTEADPPALLTTFMIGFGNAAGRGPAAYVGPTRHGLNEFAAVVGPTSRGRKDTGRDEAFDLLQRIDLIWAADHVYSGLSSGEGLIAALRDPAKKDAGDDGDQGDGGVTDKRLFLAESEFSGVLKVANREGNTLTEILRLAWDGRNLQVMTRRNPLMATAPHVSIVASITLDALRRHLIEADAANGFGNRFLFILTRRPHLLPAGGDRATREAIVGQASQLVPAIKQALTWCQQGGRTFRRDADAESLWAAVYHMLGENELPGMVGALTARAEAHLLRLSCLYAALDRTEVVTRTHLLAAIALWRYAEASVAYIFADATGDTLADRILDALATAPDGLTRTALRRRFANHVSAADLDAALTDLSAADRITEQRSPTGGRPVTRYRPTPATPGADDDPWEDLLRGSESLESTQRNGQTHAP
jgi:hypothetical protein